MKVLLLFNYPLIDNKIWKKELILFLKRLDVELMVIYGQKSVFAHLKAALRRLNNTNLKERYNSTTIPTEKLERIVRILKMEAIPFKRVNSLNSSKSISYISKYKADYIISAVDHILSKKLLDHSSVVLNSHYGNLPTIKGWNAMEWSLLIEKHLYVSLHRVRQGIDEGEIYLRIPVKFCSNDNLEAIRLKCQIAALEAYKLFFQSPYEYIKNKTENKGGSHYYLMNEALKLNVLKVVNAADR